MSGSSFATLLNLRERLGKRGVPMLGEWWLDALKEWYASPTALNLVVCAGRGSAKSHALYLVAINEALFGDFVIPPGERHSATLTSRLVEDAVKGIRIIDRWLAFLDVRHSMVDGVIELEDMPRDIRNTACSVGANSGARSYFDGNDEVGKWASHGAVVVDAEEVLTSKAALTATHPKARRMLVSSPFFDVGPFFEAVTAGTNAEQIVRQAPTWIATDGRITEEQTRKKEKNPHRHAREYGARFSAQWEHGYFAGLIEPCVAEEAPLGWEPSEDAHHVIAVDQAFSVDQYVICVAHHEKDGLIRVDRVVVVEPKVEGEKLSPTYALEKTKEMAEHYSAHLVTCDQAFFAPLADLAARIDLHLDEDHWTAQNKGPLFDYTRTLMRDGKLVIPNDAGLKRELSGIGTKLLPSGHEQITARPGFRDDRVSAMVMAVAKASQTAPRVRRRRKAGEPPRFFTVSGCGSRSYGLGRGETEDERIWNGIPDHVTEITVNGVPHSRQAGGGGWNGSWG